MLQLAHFCSGFEVVASPFDSSSLIGIPALDGRPLAEVGVGFAVEVRRLPEVGAVVVGTVLVDWSTKLALRAVPVKVRSACL